MTTTIAVTCVVVVVLNVFTAPRELAEQGVLAIVLTPQILGIGVLAVLSLLAGRSPRLRWVEVIALIIVGLLSTLTADSPQLTSFFYGSTGIALAAEYGFLRRRAALKLTLWGGAYVVALGVPALGGTTEGWLDAALTITAAVAVCLIVWFVVQARLDAHEQREAELSALVAERTKDLDASLQAQSALLREIHHRTKNNLQLVSSMLAFVERTADATIPEMVGAARGRILALGRVHELLYNETSSGFTQLSAYLNEYVAELQTLFASTKFSVRAKIEVETDVPLDTAVRVSLIVNEIAMMAMERGSLAASSADALHLEATEHKGVVVLDTREAAAAGQSKEELEKNLSVQIIGALAETLGGTWDLQVEPDVRWRIAVPVTEAALTKRRGGTPVA